jgi:hypothetical protein
MPFFQQFPKIPYDFGSNGIDSNIVDLFRFVKANEQYFHEVATYIDYQIRDGERPDIVSNSLYGTPEYYWVFFLINEHLKNGISGWPMSDQELIEYIAEEYPGTIIETRPYISRTGDGLIFDQPNSLSNRFIFGETIFGSASSARGIVISKNIQQSQLQAVTLDQFRLTVVAPVALTAGSFVIGSNYKIVTVGNTTFPGAATNTVGSVFTATGIGTGTGTVHPTYTVGESISMTLPNGTIRSALIFEVESQTSLIVGYVSGNFTAGLSLTGAISKCSRAHVSIAQVERLFQDTEIITGQNSGDTVTSYKVYSSPDAPHHYLNSEGLISYNSVHVDEQGINDVGPGNQVGTAEADLTAISNRAYEIEVNEQRSTIRIIHPDYIYKFVQLYYSLINKNAS